jgi:hypothetical protein
MMLNNLSDFIFKNRYPNSFVYKETNVRHGVSIVQNSTQLKPDSKQPLHLAALLCCIKSGLQNKVLFD